MAPTFWCVLSLAALGACACMAPSRDMERTAVQLDALQVQVSDHQQRLERLKGEIARSEAEAQRARALANFERCRAEIEGMRAQVQFERAQCLYQLGQVQACEASSEKHVATSGVAGCLLGIAAATFSVGVGTPLAVGGCTVGLVAGKATQENCPRVDCELREEAILTRVLTARGRSALPRCGGHLGIRVRPDTRRARGPVVDRVNEGSMAAAMQLLPGDIILRVGAQETPDPDVLRSVVAGLRPGPYVPVQFVREGRLYVTAAAAQWPGAVEAVAQTMRLGVWLQPTPREVLYESGVIVADVAPNGPAAQAGLRAGLSIESVEGTPVTSPAALAEVLNRFAPGTGIALGLTHSDGSSARMVVRLSEAEEGGEL